MTYSGRKVAKAAWHHQGWQDVTSAGQEPAVRRIGPLTLWCHHTADEVRIGYVQATESDMPVEPEPGNKHHGSGPPETEPSEWHRFALPDSGSALRLLPVMPDRPVVVNPEYPFQLLPEAEARVYTRIPVFVRIVPVNKPDMIITEIPTVTLSNTWFGEFTEGQLCYGLTTTARREITEELYRPHMAVCPIRIVNRSEEKLKFERFRLTVERLTVYGTDTSLWADETVISHQGGAGYSDIEMKGSLPREAQGGSVITEPRSPVRKSVAERTFKMLKELPGVGGF